MANKVLKNVRYNPVTDSFDYFFPREIKHSTNADQEDTALADKDYARLNGLQIGMARLGFRTYEAIFIPCKNFTYGPKGNLVFLDTPEEVQHRRYLDLIKDELKWQDSVKQDGRCPIPDGKGGLKRCPCRVPNPAYVEGGDAPKTLPVKCKGCAYEQFRQAHTTVSFTTLDHEYDDGEVECFEASAPAGYYEAERYERMCKGILDCVMERYPKLTGQAVMRLQEYKRSEAARKLDIPVSTAGSRDEQLKDLYKQFLDSTIIV